MTSFHSSAQTAYISLGSNLEEPEHQVLQAVEQISEIPESTLVGASRLYRSAPVGPEGQPDYINAVVALETHLAPLALLDALQAIEQHHGRVRHIRWGARTLDLDILLYGQEVIQSERLIIPHREMHWRNFVLQPLGDITPELVLPTGQKLQNLLQTVGSEGLLAIGNIPLPEPA